MQRYYAERLLKISRFSSMLEQICVGGDSQIEVPIPGNALEDIRHFERDCRDLGLKVSAAEAQRLVLGLSREPKPTVDTALDLVSGLLKALETELSTAYFFKLEDRNAELILPLPHFGEAVIRVFPNAESEIAEASACLALDRFQGCVFHSMLVLEHGLRWMCAELNIPFPAFDQWGKIIEDIERAISALNIPRTDAVGRERREILAGAASHFRMVKDGWRNHVSHGRGAHYGPEAAEAIYRSVRQLMMELADYHERTGRP